MNARFLFACLALSFSINGFGQGQIMLANRNLRLPSGDAYHVPIWIDINGNGTLEAGEGIGSYAAALGQTATLGLYSLDGSTPLATALFRSDDNGQFLGVPTSQSVVVPDFLAGERAPLTLKAWIGPSYETAIIRASWNFTSQPLGGTPPEGLPILPPPINGWGDTTAGAGFPLSAPSGPVAGTDTLTRGTLSDARVSIQMLLANDSDPGGGPVTFGRVDAVSNGGAAVSVVDDAIVYHAAGGAPDFFYYTIRNGTSGLGRGRVEVIIDDPEGMIVFANRNLAKLTEEGVYDVPIFVDANFDGLRSPDEGFGRFATSIYGQPANLGLFLKGSDAPLAISQFRTDALSAFLGDPGAQTLVIPGAAPGSRVELTVKAWIGPSFEESRVKGSWDFLSLPLGGSVVGGPSFAIPGLSGWGDENGLGLALSPGEKPIVGPDIIFIGDGDVVRIPTEVLLPNDSDPNGGTVTVISVQPISHTGVPINFFGGTITFELTPLENDFFVYTVTTAAGATATGRVDVELRDGPAKIFLSNRLVRRSMGDGAYNVPVWVDANFNGRPDAGEGIGDFGAKQFSQPATLGLFLRGGTAPLATARFHSVRAGAFLEEPAFQEVTIPSARAGTSVELTMKAWVGDNFESAVIKGAWDFTSRRLGGRAGGAAFDIPDVSGWGDETSNAGYAIIPGVKPRTFGQVLTRQTGQNVNTKIALMMQNDTDPDGGALSFVSVDESSKQGAVVTVLGNTVYYIAAIQDSDTPDYFEYTVRNSHGGMAKGRVDVVVTDSEGQFNTRLAIESLAEGNRISFRGVMGANYLLQVRDGFEAAWRDLSAATHAGFGMFQVDDPLGGAARFYRVLTQP